MVHKMITFVLLVAVLSNAQGEPTLYKRKEKTPTLPMDDPRCSRDELAGPYAPEQIFLSYAGPGAVAINWVTWPQDDPRFAATDNTEDTTYLTISRKLSMSLDHHHHHHKHKHHHHKKHSTLSNCDRMQRSGLVKSVVQYSFAPFSDDESSSSPYQQVTGTFTCYEMGDYQSGALHSVTIGETEGPLPPNTTVYYRVGNPDADTWSDELSFTSAPAVGASHTSLPYRIGLLGDVGQTEHSASTVDHLMRNNPDSIIFAGDLSYADGFQPRWDTWGRLMTPLTSSKVVMFTEGNHEQEPNDDNTDWVAYESRFHQPYQASQSTSPLYYSYEVAGAHIVMLGSYTDYDEESEQYSWLQRDLAGVDRKKTPWLLVAMHAPWYNSNHNHQGEGEDMRKAMESLLYEHGVDAVISGHVHAYERSRRTYDYEPDECGPVYVNIGDGGNREGLDFDYYEQPVWSDYREPSYGHGLIDLFNATHARFSWHRNQDEEAEEADEFWFVREVEEGFVRQCGVKHTLVGQERNSHRRSCIVGVVAKWLYGKVWMPLNAILF